MQGSSHYGFAAATAVTVNNLVYLFPLRILPEPVVHILQSIGAPLTYQHLPYAAAHYFSDLTSWTLVLVALLILVAQHTAQGAIPPPLIALVSLLGMLAIGALAALPAVHVAAQMQVVEVLRAE